MTRTRLTGSKNMVLNRHEAISSIDAAAERVRARFATPGKHAIYADKRAEAIRYLDQVQASEQPEMDQYPYLAAEIGLTAGSAVELAELWLQMDASWRGVAALIEHISLGAKAQIRQASSRQEINSIIISAAISLDAIGDKPPERPK